MTTTLDIPEGLRQSVSLHSDRADSRETAIRITNLRKRYAAGGEMDAVRGVSLEIFKGEIFGLIGPDGAGKTSIFQILGGVMPASSGEVEVFRLNPRDARHISGYLTQAFSLYADLTVSENLQYVGRLRHLTAKQVTERSDHHLGLFDMKRFKGRLAGNLSGGMKQKLALTCALIAQPTILLLDEPTTGVDPVSRREFWDTLATLAGEGMTIVVATPYLDEAERCSRVALMHDGTIHEVGTPTEIRNRLGLERLEVRADELRHAEQTINLLTRTSPELADVQRFGDRLDVMTSDIQVGERLIRDALLQQGLGHCEIEAGTPTLENAFVSILRVLEPDPMPVSQQTVESSSRTLTKTRLKERASDIAIGASHLYKGFGAFNAVKDVNIEVKYGEIYGLLGANGAGKTTTIKMLCGLLSPTRGELTLAGERGSLRSSATRRRVGYMSQKFSLYDDLTVGENLSFFAGVYQVPEAQREEKKRWALEFSGLSDRSDTLTSELPGGWKQRVAFGAAIMHEPEVLFLDEPTSGVDPLARRAFWRMINILADRGVAILVTTHYLEEAEQCNRLGLMVGGELVAEGSPSGIKQAQEGHLLEMITDQPQRAAELLKREMDRWRVSLFGERLHVVVDETPMDAIRRLTRRLANDGVGVIRAYEERFSLEDSFIAIVEKTRQRA